MSDNASFVIKFPVMMSVILYFQATTGCSRIQTHSNDTKKLIVETSSDGSECKAMVEFDFGFLDKGDELAVDNPN